MMVEENISYNYIKYGLSQQGVVLIVVFELCRVHQILYWVFA